MAEVNFGHEKNILIIIGYADSSDTSNLSRFFYRPHYKGISYSSEFQIRRVLTELGTVNEENPYEFINKNKGLRIRLINTNVLCPGEKKLVDNKRLVLCFEQIDYLKQVIQYLNQNLRYYDEIIYLGHAREGHGLGIGPFTDEYTYPLKFYNSLEIGKLKRFVFAACDTNVKYKYLIQSLELVGTNGKKDWISELLPMVLLEIQKIHLN